MALKDIIDVQVVRETSAAIRPGFGVALFVFEVASGDEPAARVMEYSGIEEVADSFDTASAAYLAGQAAFSGDLSPTRIKIGYKLESESWAEAIQALIDYDNGWYALAIDSVADQDITDVAAVIESVSKIFIAKTASDAVLDPADDTDIASTLLTSSYSRTAMIYHSDAAITYPDMAWMGGQLPKEAGSITWAYKTLPGIAGESFTGSQITALDKKRVSRYEIIGGVPTTLGGYTFDSGAFIDLIRGIDWLESEMAYDLFDIQVRSEKIPYTSAGIAIVEGAVRSRLQLAIAQGVIADDENLKVSAPRIQDTEFTDRANRLLKNVSFTARLQGAIHKIIVRGTVTA